MHDEVGVESLRHQVAGVRWYHSIRLPGGVVTPGLYDLETSVPRSLLPPSLVRRRCLDVGTHDGFWAFEMERRGASEVVALDLDDPARYDLRYPVPPVEMIQADIENRRRAFHIAHDALGSRVQRRDLSVYDLDPDVAGRFDFAFIGTLLHHLRDPVGALIALRSVVQGELVISATFSISKTVLFPRSPASEMLPSTLPAFWNVPNLVALRRQVEAAGWTVVRSGRPYLQRYGAGRSPSALLTRPWAELPRRAVLRYGAPHVALVAEPA